MYIVDKKLEALLKVCITEKEKLEKQNANQSQILSIRKKLCNQFLDIMAPHNPLFFRDGLFCFRCIATICETIRRIAEEFPRRKEKLEKKKARPSQILSIKENLDDQLLETLKQPYGKTDAEKSKRLIPYETMLRGVN